MIRLDERGKQCPLPVIEAKKALETASAGEQVEVIVDNEIAVQNLKKLGDYNGLAFSSQKKGEREYAVVLTAAGNTETASQETEGQQNSLPEPAAVCCPDGRRKGMVAVISSREMGQGDPALGALLMKGFIYALTQQEVLPEAVLLYNGGAFLSCEGSDNLEDLKTLEAQGVEILTCGTCLNHYGLGDKLRAGSVTNMYEIAERMTGAALLIRP